MNTRKNTTNVSVPYRFILLILISKNILLPTDLTTLSSPYTEKKFLLKTYTILPQNELESINVPWPFTLSKTKNLLSFYMFVIQRRQHGD